MGAYKDQVIEELRAHDEARPRSQQSEIGWSEVMACRSYVGFKLEGAWETDSTDSWAAMRGTFLDEAIFAIRAAANPHLLHQVEVEWAGIPGHADEVDPIADEVTDLKTTKLANIAIWTRDESALLQKRVQAQGYARALVEAGILRNPTVRLLVAPIDGTFADWWEHEEPYDPAVAELGVARLAEVKAAKAAGEMLPRDKPFAWCEQWCEFFAICRGDGPPPGELITDPETAAAIDIYGTASEVKGAADKEMKRVAPLIRNVRGHTEAGWQISMTRPSGTKPVMDEDRVREIFAANGLEVPTKDVPTSYPSLRVTRLKETPKE